MKKQELITPFSGRQYMFSEDFELYYYSDMPGKAVASHTHDYYEFYFFLEGYVKIHIENTECVIHPGDFLVIPPGIHHNPEFMDTQTPYRRFVLWLSKDYCNRLMNASLDYGYLLQHVVTTHTFRYENDVVSFNDIQARLFNITDEIKGNRFGKDAKISLEINDLLLTLNRMVYERNSYGLQRGSARLSTSVSEYIETHLEDDLSLDRLEREFFVSRYHISHAFKEDMGISIHRYIQMKRLEACRKAIRAGTPVTRAYTLYGFTDYSAFYRAFKQAFGISPKEATYRD